MMDPARAFIGDLVGVLLFSLIVGILVRQRHRLCWTFCVYAVAVFVADRLTRGWPSTFDTAWFWMLKESVFAWLKVAIVAEIGLLTFFRLPRARRILAWLLIALVGAAMLAQLAPSDSSGVGGALPWLSGELIPWVSISRGQAGVLCLFAAVVVLSAHYQVPIHPFHRGILFGFALYLLVYTTAIAILRERGAQAYELFLAMDPTAYAATVGLWAWTSWRRDPEPSHAARILHPWAYSQ